MPTDLKFRDDAYLRECAATVVALTDQGGIVLDSTVFYANSGGQPGDRGALVLADGTELPVTSAVFTDAAKSEIAHVVADDASARPAVGDAVTARIDWELRYARMRMHTALHLLSAALPYPGHRRLCRRRRGPARFRHPGCRARQGRHRRQGGGDDRVRRRRHGALDHRRGTRGQSGAGEDDGGEAAGGHRTSPPDRDHGLDLQPCGGTHVRHTAEIGAVRVTQIEKKGKQNRRVRLTFG